MLVGYIYGLHHPLTGELRYVGQTWGSLHNRLRGHQADARRKQKRYVCKWVAALLRDGLTPNIVEIARAESQEELDRLEIFWISVSRDRGCRLTNHSDGGGGRKGMTSPMKGRRHSAEARAKISQSKQGQASFTGKQHSVETRNLISTKKRGNQCRFRMDVPTSSLVGALQGKTVGDVARQFGIDRHTLRKRLRKAEGSPIPKREIPTERILQLLGGGLSKATIATQLGVSESFVYKRLQHSGVHIPKLKPGPKPKESA